MIRVNLGVVSLLVWQKFAFKKAKALKMLCVASNARSNKKTSLRM